MSARNPSWCTSHLTSLNCRVSSGNVTSDVYGFLSEVMTPTGCRNAGVRSRPIVASESLTTQCSSDSDACLAVRRHGDAAATARNRSLVAFVVPPELLHMRRHLSRLLPNDRNQAATGRPTNGADRLQPLLSGSLQSPLR